MNRDCNSKDGKESGELIDKWNILNDESIKIVCHMVDTSDDNPPKGSWIDYWNKNIKTSLPKSVIKCPCCEKEFEISKLVGAHVYTVEDNIGYITPICDNCNKQFQSKSKEEAKEYTFTVQKGYLCPLPKESKCRRNS